MLGGLDGIYSLPAPQIAMLKTKNRPKAVFCCRTSTNQNW